MHYTYLELAALFAVTFFLLTFYSKNKNQMLLDEKAGNAPSSSLAVRNRIIFFAVVLILTWYGGLRTVFNDTYAYIRGFNELSASFSDIPFVIKNHPVFLALEVLIKNIFNGNYHWFLLICTGITVWGHLDFILRKGYSVLFCFFLYYTFCGFLFSFAAIKQSLATAIMLFAMRFIEKKKWVWYYVFLAIAVLIHPYVILYAAAPFFLKVSWGKKNYLIILASIVIGIFSGPFISFLSGIMGSIGDDFTEETLSGTGVNPLRVAVLFVVAFLTWIYREKIQEENDPILNLSVNFTVVAFVLMFIALFGNPNLFGRMANYFVAFDAISFSFVLKKCILPKDRGIVTAIAVICFTVFGYYNFGYPINAVNVFGRVGISALFG